MGSHIHHSRAFMEIERRRDDGEGMVLAAPALVEAYSVMTRLPPPHRLPGEIAMALIEANFINGEVRMVAMSAAAYTAMLREASREGIVGGRVYDAVIVACAVSAGVSAILTFNESHFRSLAVRDIRIVVPGG